MGVDSGVGAGSAHREEDVGAGVAHRDEEVVDGLLRVEVLMGLGGVWWAQKSAP